MLPTVVPVPSPSPSSVQKQRKGNSGKVLLAIIFLVHFLFFIIFLQRLRQQTTSRPSHTTEQQTSPTSLPFDGDIGCVNPPVTSLSERASQIRQLERQRRMKVVIIDTDAVHHRVRRLIGSIHRFHRPSSDSHNSNNDDDEYNDEIRIVVYGVRLDQQFVSELLLWKNVDYVDIWKDMVKSHRLVETESINASNVLDEERWRPFILRHALERYEKILYMDANLVLESKLSDIEKHLDQHGSYFVGDPSLAAEKEDTPAVMPHCSHLVQGFTVNHYAHQHILAPMTHCMSRDCTAEDRKLIGLPSRDAWEAIPEQQHAAMTCQPMPATVLRLQDDGVDANAHCYIHTREDLLFSAAQIKWGQTGENKKPRDDTRTWIAIGMPSTSKGTNPSNIPEGLPLFDILLPSFLSTIRRSSKEKQYLYKFFLVYDAGDPWYDNAENQKRLHKLFASITNGYPVSLQTIRSVQTYGWTTFLWNVAFRFALDEGFDYFYQVNDDLKFLTPGWTDVLVNRLRNNPVRSNFGATGPIDTNHGKIFTQSFVHRTHFDIFGYYYPPIFRNWFSDDWITHVYTKTHSTLLTEVKVTNSNAKGTRYSACATEGGARLKTAKSIAEDQIERWLYSSSSLRSLTKQNDASVKNKN